jgi:nicotinate-nucleotide adenylyltransferase
MQARVAIFGGVFDPIHNAHLAVARAAADRFRLDRVLFVPSHRPPHKRGATHASYEDRLHMVEIACASDARFEASRLEERAESNYSYSIDTIQKLRATLHPEDELFFIIGADAFADLHTWHRWEDVIGSVRFIVVSRPGYSYNAPAGTKVDRLDELELVTSSSELRERLKTDDKNLDAPPGVIEYIRLHGLYGAAQI